MSNKEQEPVSNIVAVSFIGGNLWFSLCTPIFLTNKADRHDITEILLKVELNTITLTPLHNK